MRTSFHLSAVGAVVKVARWLIPSRVTVWVYFLPGLRPSRVATWW